MTYFNKFLMKHLKNLTDCQMTKPDRWQILGRDKCQTKGLAIIMSNQRSLGMLND